MRNLSNFADLWPHSIIRDDIAKPQERLITQMITRIYPTRSAPLYDGPQDLLWSGLCQFSLKRLTLTGRTFSGPLRLSHLTAPRTVLHRLLSAIASAPYRSQQARPTISRTKIAERTASAPCTCQGNPPVFNGAPR